MFKVRFLEIETNPEGNILICDNHLCTGQRDFSSRTTCGDLPFLRANVSEILLYVGVLFCSF